MLAVCGVAAPTGTAPTPIPGPGPQPVGTMTGGDGTTGGVVVGGRIPEPSVRLGLGTWYNEQAKVIGDNGRTTITSEWGSVHPGYTRCYKFVNMGSPTDFGMIGGPHLRTEMAHCLKKDGVRIQPHEGETDYWAGGLYLPPGFINKMGDNLTFFQMHPPYGQPTRIRLDTTGKFSARATIPPEYNSGPSKVGSRRAVEGGWMKWVLKIKWGAAGRVDFWWAAPGETAFTYDISNLTANNLSGSGYWKCGGYFSATKGPYPGHESVPASGQLQAVSWGLSNLVLATSFEEACKCGFGVTIA